MSSRGPASLSVILPNYNDAHCLGEALESIFRQSLPPQEVVVVDDASTDGSPALLGEFAKRHPTLRWFRNEKNEGPILCMNRAFQATTGEYVHFLGADDRVLPGFYERSIRLLSQYPEAGLSSTLGKLLGEAGEDLGLYPAPVLVETPCFLSPEKLLLLFKRIEVRLNGTSVIFRRGAVLEAGGLRPELRNYADNILMRLVAFRRGLCFIPEVLCAGTKSARYGASLHADPQTHREIAYQITKFWQAPEHHSFLPGKYAARWSMEWVYSVCVRDLQSCREHLEEFRKAMHAPRGVDRVWWFGMRILMGGERLWSLLYSFLALRREPALRVLTRKVRSVCGL